MNQIRPLFRHRRFIVAVLCVVLNACATVPDPEAEVESAAKLAETLANQGYVIGDTVLSVTDKTLRNWELIDDKHIILSGSRRNNYLLTFTQECPDLDKRFALGVDSASGRLSNLDQLVFYDGHLRFSCWIDQLQLLEASA